ncbi:NAD(P)/FAD-dependent oxidoreductase [Soonwooa sp.]|uniref:NAD(P)/FAD-dependent oxidoreductase n=1 Tax=Soonwooa sp. TaxID=1938592 RepID=UPI002605A70F|nr:NAD(P)/FAD-dependent oxidoreductase [Soonwooa sp.]
MVYKNRTFETKIYSIRLMKQVVIIGGGAAGFFCAANLDENKYQIKILEQNKDVLQKVKISGGGRCNVTHACFDPQDLVKFYPRGEKELRSVFSKFQPGDTMEWFESRGVSLKIENDNRIFPDSNQSQSIINALQTETQNKNVEVITQATVSQISKTEDQFLIETKSGNFNADYVVFTTGSAPKSLKLVESLGHKIVSLVPSLFTFNIKNPLLAEHPGTSFEWAEVSIPKLKLEESGPLLITHWGLSGPAVLKLSAWGARLLAGENYKFEILVNFISKSIQEAEEDFINFKESNPKKTIGQSKIYNVTNRFWNSLLAYSKIDSEKQISNISKKEMQILAGNLCEMKLQVDGKSTFKDEFVTAGGVDLKEINFKTMESKVVPNLFLAGEVLNIDAITGGFNFQACWSEAWLIAQELNMR